MNSRVYFLQGDSREGITVLGARRVYLAWFEVFVNWPFTQGAL